MDYPVIADAFRKSNATLPSSAAVERLFCAAAHVNFGTEEQRCLEDIGQPVDDVDGRSDSLRHELNYVAYCRYYCVCASVSNVDDLLD